MTGPVYVYYELRNFYQNHRLYAKSLNTHQLQGGTPDDSDLQSSCFPIVYNKDLFVSNAIDGTPLDPEAVANPCGMIAYTLFNDSFSLGNNVDISASGIAWPSDKSKYQISNRSLMWTDTT